MSYGGYGLLLPPLLSMLLLFCNLGYRAGGGGGGKGGGCMQPPLLPRCVIATLGNAGCGDAAHYVLGVRSLQRTMGPVGSSPGSAAAVLSKPIPASGVGVGARLDQSRAPAEHATVNALPGIARVACRRSAVHGVGGSRRAKRHRMSGASPLRFRQATAPVRSPGSYASSPELQGGALYAVLNRSGAIVASGSPGVAGHGDGRVRQRCGPFLVCSSRPAAIPVVPLHGVSAEDGGRQAVLAERGDAVLIGGEGDFGELDPGSSESLRGGGSARQGSRVEPALLRGVLGEGIDGSVGPGRSW